MKQSTVLFSRITKKIITLTLITLLTAGLIPHVSTTVKADTTSDILNAYTYKYYVVTKEGKYSVWLIDQAIQSTTESADYSLYDLNQGFEIKLENTTSNYFYYAAAVPSDDKPIILNYNNGIWETVIPLYSNRQEYQITNQEGYNYPFYTAWFFGVDEVITSYSTTIPSGFPNIDLNSGVTLDQVQTEINNKLNATTSLTTQANNIQTQITNNYISYSNGEIDLATLQANIDSLAQQLENLNNSSGATIADKISINNAITQTQLVQDAANKDAIIQEMEEDLTVSESIKSQIISALNRANIMFTFYDAGSITQTEALNNLNQIIIALGRLITQEMPIADVNAINTTINTINGVIDNIVGHSELSPDVAEEQVNSDQEEIELLNEMVSVMQDQVIENKMEDQQVAGSADQINNVLNPIWNNKYMTYLIGVSGVLIIACIVLHTKYRML